MTVKEIKNLAKFLTEEELDKIKKEIKSKEDILKKEDIEEEELGRVLNTLFSILVIEKTLENEIEGIEEMRDELERELLESYQIYDEHMAKYKKADKKKKKRNWLLDFLFLGDRVGAQKEGIGAANKKIDALRKELDHVKRQTSDANLEKVMGDLKGHEHNMFCDCPEKINQCDICGNGREPMRNHRDHDGRHHDHNHHGRDNIRLGDRPFNNNMDNIARDFLKEGQEFLNTANLDSYTKQSDAARDTRENIQKVNRFISK